MHVVPEYEFYMINIDLGLSVKLYTVISLYSITCIISEHKICTRCHSIIMSLNICQINNKLINPIKYNKII